MGLTSVVALFMGPPVHGGIRPPMTMRGLLRAGAPLQHQLVAGLMQVKQLMILVQQAFVYRQKQNGRG
jgi:hypothetical protein